MSVIYRDELSRRSHDDFSQRLSEAQEFFAERHGTNIIGRDIETVLSTNTLFESYKDKLLEGFDSNSMEDLDTLMNSTREQCLQESVAGVQPYAALTMPILVKLWARLSMKYAIPTEPVTKPAFSVAFMLPYMIDSDGNKHYLPESINKSPEEMIDKTRLVEEVTATEGKIVNYNLFTGADGTVLGDIKKGDTIDRKFTVTEVTIGGKAYKTNIKLDINRRLYGEILVEGVDTKEDTSDDVYDIILGSVDLEKGIFNLTAMNSTIESVKILGWLSSESHNTAVNVSFDIDRRDIEIGTGTHIEANVPLELLQDVKAMYQVDGAAEVVDIMSNVSAQKVDLDIIEFLERAYKGTDAMYHKDFDVYPDSGYHMHPNEWLEGLKKVIDYVAQSMKNDFKSYDGYFVIVGNPLDTMLIPNVNWTFQNASDTMNGVNVTYSLGAVSGANRYSVISSDLIPQGNLTMFLVPTTDKYKTFTYYPYSFNVVNNYLNTRMQNVPSIMLTRRYTVEEFMPIIGQITIWNNEATVFARSVTSTSTNG